MSEDEIHLLCHIKGKVQGVGYRAWTRVCAEKFGVRGWVKNEPDGSVLACFAGTRQSVRALITQCHEGPSAASVTTITEQPAPADDSTGGGFRILY